MQLDLHVDPVEQRPGEPAEVAAAGQRRALAARCRPAGFAHGQGLAASDELDPGRVLGAAAGAAQHDPAVSPAAGAAPPARRALNSGASSRNSTPAVGQRDRARAGPGRSRRRPAPPRVAVWCGAWNGGRRSSGRAGGSSAGDRVQRGHLQRGVVVELGQDRRAGARPAWSCRRPADRTAPRGARRRRRPRSPAGPAPWPATSARSGPGSRRRRRVVGRVEQRRGRRGRTPTSRCSESTARTRTPGTTAASRALPSGTITRLTPARAAAATIGSTPRTGRTVPSRPSSPRTTTPSSGAERQLAGRRRAAPRRWPGRSRSRTSAASPAAG